MKRWNRHSRGFTLVELLVAIVIFAGMLSMLILILANVQRVWLFGQENVEISQNARAILDLMSRELSPAVASKRLQFVQSPNIQSLVPNLAPVAPSLFWMVPGDPTDKGNLYEVGYFLTRSDTAHTYDLNRFYVTPVDANGYYLGADDYDLQSSSSLRPASFATSALWLTKLSKNAFDTTSTKTATSVVSEGVIAMWIRCLDNAGNPIPWLYQATSYTTASPIQFCSGAGFNMAPTGSVYSGTSTFAYTVAPPTGQNSNQLPASVEITLVMLDSRTLARKPTIPAMPAATTPAAIPSQVAAFNASLNSAGIKTARTFVARVPMINSML